MKADVRGFSAFSEHHESTDITIFAKMYEIGRLGSLRVYLPTYIKQGSEIKVTMICPKMRKSRVVKGYHTHRAFRNFENNCEVDEPKVILGDLLKTHFGVGAGKG